jgi:translation initiation factor 4G
VDVTSRSPPDSPPARRCDFIHPPASSISAPPQRPNITGTPDLTSAVGPLSLQVTPRVPRSRPLHTSRTSDPPHPLMTSAIPPAPADPLSAQNATLSAAPVTDTTSSLSGAVPAQLPGRSYASATKTATPNTSTPAGASSAAQNAKPASESPVNGANPMAQGGPHAGNTVPNGTPNSGDHGRKPSVVISASGASGYTPNGGPVSSNGRTATISFGSMGQGSPMPTASAPYQAQSSSLATPQTNPRATTPTHSPSPIPQPPASGGRPPPSMQNQSNGMQFGSMGGDSDPVSLSDCM